MSLVSTIARLDFEASFEDPAWNDVAAATCKDAGVEFARLERASSSDHVVYLIDDRLVLKIFRPGRSCFERERKALEFAEGITAFRTPGIVNVGNFEGLDHIVTTQVPGQPFTRPEFLKLERHDQIGILSDLAAGLKQLHEMETEQFVDDWADFVAERANTFIDRQIAHGVNAKVIDALPAFIEDYFPLVPESPTSFLHGDVHFGNLQLVQENGKLRIGGLFDFADSRRGYHEYEFLAVGVLMIQGERVLQREFLRAYGYADSDLNENMRTRLMMLTLLYETSDLRRYALRLRPEAVDYTLDELERAIWSFV